MTQMLGRTNMSGFPIEAIGGHNVTLIKKPGSTDERRLTVFGAIQAEIGLFRLTTDVETGDVIEVPDTRKPGSMRQLWVAEVRHHEFPTGAAHLEVVWGSAPQANSAPGSTLGLKGEQGPAMESRLVVRVVLASPGDVKDERDVVAAVVEEVNTLTAHRDGLDLELLRWETDAFSGFHAEGPQGLIDDVLKIEESSIVIGIFWKRFGTPVKDAGSGTEHEILRAYESWQSKGRPEIMLYFKTAPFSPSSTSELEQMGAVLKFRERIKNEAVYFSFDSPVEFERMLRRHLSEVVRRLVLPKVNIAEAAKVESALAGVQRVAPEDLSQLPTLAFKGLRWRPTPYNESSLGGHIRTPNRFAFDLVNVGPGPALDLRLTVAQTPIPYVRRQDVGDDQEPLVLPAGGSVEVAYRPEGGRGLTDQEWDTVRRTRVAGVVTATYRDVRGRDLRSEAELRFVESGLPGGALEFGPLRLVQPSADEELTRRAQEALLAGAARKQDDRQRIERAGACHQELHDWLRAMAQKAMAVDFANSRRFEDNWPRSAMSGQGAKLAFPVSLTWSGGDPKRSLMVGVDERRGWILWELRDSAGRQADHGEVDPRSYQAGLQPLILRLVTDSEWVSKE
jgi:hypothetical protein